MDNIQPVFILGNPRSGTSLFRIMLNAHPEIVAPPESGFAHWWLKKYKNWSKSDVNTSRLQEYLNDLMSSKKIETWHLDIKELKRIILEKQPSSYGELVACIYLSYSNSNEKIKIICDKNNYYINHIDELSLIWPNAKFVHMVRDGRDVACSYLDMNNVETQSQYKPILHDSIPEIANEWVNNNQSIAELKEKKKDNYCLVRYEDLILEQEETLRKFCKFLGIDFSISMLEYYSNRDKNKVEPKETLDWKKRTKEKPDKQRINRYKTILTEEELFAFNSKASVHLQYFNYEL